LPEEFAKRVIRLTEVIVELSVTDVQRAIDFYADALGFVAGIRYEEGGHLDFASVKSGTITLFLHHTMREPDSPEAARARKRVKLWFRPDDLLGLHAQLRQKGYAVTEPRATAYGATEFSLEDPDGYTVFLQQSRDKGDERAGCGERP
jgi:catechol 2,3-dioxygenase-like lactoylglutathione lyase family enzyme